MLNKRTPNTKTWMNFDGSYTTEIHSGIVHYEDENGNLQNINTDLYDEADFDQIDFPVAKDGDSLFYEAQARAVSDKKKNRLDRDKFDFQGLKVPFDCKIPRNIKRGYSIGKGRSGLSFIPVGASSSKGYVEGNKITYPDVWPDTDVVLEMLETGIKETIILKTNKAPFDFSFEVQGNLEGEMKIQPPWLQDAEGTKRDVVQGVSEVDGKIFLNLAANVSGLVYPIEIDPTVITQPDGASGIDAYIYSASPNGNSNGAALYTGYDGSGVYRSLMKFDVSTIPLGSSISSAILTLYAYSHSGHTNSFNQQLSVREATGSWGEANVTWNTQPPFNPNVSATNIFTGPSKFYDFQIKEIAQKWVNDVNYGLVFKSESESINMTYIEWLSSDHGQVNQRPKLSITYNQPPTAPTVISPNGGETWNSLHTVEWGAATDPADKITDLETTTMSTDILTNLGNGDVYQVIELKANTRIDEISIKLGSNVANNTHVTFKITLNNTSEDVLYSQLLNVNGYGLNTPQVFTLFPKILSAPTDRTLRIKVTNSIPGGSLSVYGYFANSYPYGSLYIAGTQYSDRDMWVKVVNNYSTPQSQLKYHIQLTTNNGGSWKDIVSLTAAGVTSYPYDFINEAESSLAKIRIRAYDGSAYGPWDESNGVFTIQHNQAPTEPTNLNPPSGTIDRAAVNRLSWQHNDANADPQAKFDLQWRVQGSTTWNDITQSTVNQFYDAPANLFPRGTIEWRVRTYDQADLSSPYSNIATFFSGDKSAMPTIVLPGPTVAVANPTVQWSSTDQTGFLLTVKDAAGTTVFSKERNSTNKAETITYSLENQQEYTIELKIKNADELYSDAAVLNISVSYTPPAIPDIETVKGDSFVQINITDPIPTGTQPAVLYHEIYKEIDKEFVLIATNIKNEYKDYNVASREITRYFVRTLGDNDTFSDTTTFSESISLTGVWLHVVEDPENTIHEFKADGGGRSSKWGLENAVHHFQGRKRPVIETGEMEDFSVDFSLDILDDLERAALESIVYSHETVCYRDGRGRKAFGVFVNVPLNDVIGGLYSTSLTLTKIDFKEGIE